MSSGKKEFRKQVLVLSIERIGVTDEVVKQKQSAPLLALRVLNYFPHYPLLPLIVQVSLRQPHRRPRRIEMQSFTEDEDVLTEQGLVPVFGQSQHILKHVRFTGVRRAAADKAERRLGEMRMGDQTRAIMFRAQVLYR